jgi:hypothetical protein
MAQMMLTTMMAMSREVSFSSIPYYINEFNCKINLFPPKTQLFPLFSCQFHFFSLSFANAK